jgi:hypothetical protein
VSIGTKLILTCKEKSKEMGQLEVGQEVRQATAPALSQKKVKAERRLQAWHYLIPIFTVFCIGFGIVLFTGNFLFLSALAVLAVLSVLVIALAWAFQNDI